jgi:hypothetical protein
MGSSIGQIGDEAAPAFSPAGPAGPEIDERSADGLLDRIVAELIARIPSAVAIIHFGSTLNEGISRASDIDFLVAVRGGRNDRRKLSLFVEGYFCDITILLFADLHAFLTKEAEFGQPDVATALTQGALVFGGGPEIAEAKHSAAQILMNGPDHYVPAGIGPGLCQKLRRIALLIAKSSPEKRFFVLMTCYDAIYAGYMVSRRHWRGPGAFGQIIGKADGLEFANAMREGLGGKSGPILRLIADTVQTLEQRPQ